MQKISVVWIKNTNKYCKFVYNILKYTKKIKKENLNGR